MTETWKRVPCGVLDELRVRLDARIASFIKLAVEYERWHIDFVQLRSDVPVSEIASDCEFRWTVPV
jgi:hypothetical protein